MQSATKILLSAGLGAAAMYYLDPAQGHKRRATLRDQLEHGQEAATHGALHGARAIGHRTDRAIHGLRAAGHDVSDRAERAIRRARAVRHGLGHEVGKRAGRLTHGLRVVGRDTREHAAGAAEALGSTFDRGETDDGVRAITRNSSPWKLMGIPVKWLFLAGIGASMMYFLDPSQGLYRRARFRRRFDQARHKSMDRRHAGPDVPREEMPAAPDPEEVAGRQRSGDGPGPHLEDRERPLPG